jgi:hypothetical protein
MKALPRRDSHMGHKTRIMYIESKSAGLNGPARIGRVTYSKTGRTIYYRGKEFKSVRGFKVNYVDVNSHEEYWISGPRRDGEDRLYVSSLPVEIDEDVREEYWTDIRKRPDLKHLKNSN